MDSVRTSADVLVHVAISAIEKSQIIVVYRWIRCNNSIEAGQGTVAPFLVAEVEQRAPSSSVEVSVVTIMALSNCIAIWTGGVAGV